MTLTGAVNLSSNSVTFGNVPDLPLTNLTLTVTGPGGQKAFTIASCAPATVTGSFTGQGNQTADVERGDQVQQLPERPEGFGFEQRSGHRASEPQGQGQQEQRRGEHRVARGRAPERAVVREVGDQHP